MRRPHSSPRALTTALVVYDAALLVAVFYAPIAWGAFNTGGQTLIAVCVAVAALAAVVARWSQRKAPAVIPNAIHLPALVFLAISAISAIFGVSRHAGAIEMARLASGALLFALVANRAVLPLAPAKPVAIAVGASAVILLFVRVAGENDIALGALFDPTTYVQSLVGVGAALRLFALLALAGVVWVIIGDRGKERPIRWYLSALITSAAFAVATNGLREKLLAASILKNKSWQIFSTFFNPNPLGGFLAMGFFLALAAALADRLPWRRLVWGAAALLMLGAIAPTYSKGAIISLAVASVVFIVMAAGASVHRARNLRLVAALALVAIVAVCALLYASPPIRDRVTGALGPRSASNMFRILAWEGTARMAAAHPLLGVGPGGFKFAFMEHAVGGYVEAAHQNYLQVAGEQGFLGLAAFLWLIGAIIFTGRRALARAPDFAGRILVIGPLAALTVVLVHSFLDYDLYIGAIGLTFWLIAGLIAHYSHDRQPPEVSLPPEPLPQGKRKGPRQPAPRVVTVEQGVHTLRWPISGAGRAVVMVAFALGLCLTTVPPLRNALAQNAMQAGDASYMAGLNAYDARDFATMRNYLDTAFDDFRRATEFDPGWAAAWERYGVILGTMGRGKEGEDAVRRATVLEPTSFQPYMSLARLYSEQASQETGSGATRRGLYEKAVEAYRQSLARYPSNTRARRRLATTYQQLGETQKALDAYVRMELVENSDYNKYRALGDIDVDTEYAYAHYQLGRAEAARYLAGGDRKALAQAMLEFNAALGVVTAYQTQGKQMDEMFRMVGQPRENRSGELQMLEGRTRFRLAALYQRTGDKIAAAREVNQALTLYPGVADAVRREDGGLPEG